MGFIEKKISKLKNRTYSTFKNTHFSVMPIMYTFKTPLSFQNINNIVGKKAGFFHNLRRYNVLTGYCKGNRLVLFNLNFSARFLIMMRPFQGYMYKKEDGTMISGGFRFSISTKILTCAWLLNDVIHLGGQIGEPMSKNIIGHIVSLAFLPTLLARTVWKDKSQQESVIEFMKSELNAGIIEEEK